MQNFSQIGEVPWPRLFSITRILQTMTLKRFLLRLKKWKMLTLNTSQTIMDSEQTVSFPFCTRNVKHMPMLV